jgi:hypothetical protein
MVMEGGAMGAMTGAVLDGKAMTMPELVSHGMTWAINGIAGLAWTTRWSPWGAGRPSS